MEGQQEVLKNVREILTSASKHGIPDEITLRHSLNEGWFSDALAWLLDPRGDHGLGVSFLRAFLREVAKERCRDGASYARRASHLRWLKTPGRGKSWSILRLGNAASFREFYLSGGKKNSKRGDRFCDVVVLDLDSADGLVLVIENKLFGTNSTGQLRDMLLGVEDKYSRATIREFVYLTLTGENPSSILPTEKPLLNRWVALGWQTHVLQIIERLEPHPKGRLEELVVFLQWMKRLKHQADANPETVPLMIEMILTGTVDCVLFELNRLCRTGEWSRKTTGSHKHRLVHSSAKSRHLSLKLLTNCSITLQSKRSGRPQCDKLLLPFGAPSRQVFNLLHITARDLYWIHFGKPKAFLRDTVRRKRLDEVEKSFAPMLDFIAKHRFELQAMLGVGRCTRAGLVSVEES